MNKLWSIAAALTANLVRTRGAATGASSGAASIYLTFDDGPHPEHTPHLLSLLEQHGAKGAFFVIGNAIEKNSELMRRMLAEGHTIGNHSMTHPKMRRLGAGAQWAEIDRADLALQKIDGKRRHAYRPPNGRMTWPQLAATLRHQQPMVLWTIDSLDYKLSPTQVVQQLQLSTPQAGDVLLFHDDGACAAQALQVLLPIWRQAGLEFAALAL
jgi:peptidoglycan-N-acetylglucosamine deacetylase